MFLLRMSEHGPSTLSNLKHTICQCLQGPGALLPRPVKLDALEVALGRDGGRPGSVQHQGDLPKVVRGSQVANHLTLVTNISKLSHNSRAENQY